MTIDTLDSEDRVDEEKIKKVRRAIVVMVSGGMLGLFVSMYAEIHPLLALMCVGISFGSLYATLIFNTKAFIYSCIITALILGMFEKAVSIDLLIDTGWFLKVVIVATIAQVFAVSQSMNVHRGI